jgi:antitoxin ParD1/3/4
MNISLTPNQERLIQTKLQDGKYHSAEEVLEIAFRLLDEYDLWCSKAERADSFWVKDVQQKIDAAISEQTPPIDGEIFVNKILDRFQKATKNHYPAQ